MSAHPPREDEEQITQAIDVLERSVADRLDARKRQDPPLDPPAHRARLMQKSADPAAAGQDERSQRREVLLTLVDQPLERGHFPGAHMEHPLVLRIARRRELASEVEQLVLQLA